MRPWIPAFEAARKILQTNSAAIRLLGRLIPLIGRQISAVRRHSGIRLGSKRNQILARPDSAATGLNRRILLFFRVEQRNPVVVLEYDGNLLQQRSAMGSRGLRAEAISEDAGLRSPKLLKAAYGGRTMG